MDDIAVFKDRNIIGICDYISNICELYIHSTTLTEPLVRPFYTFFPTLLVYIFGSPNARGWLHTETPAAQDIAIRKLLSVNGPFFQAIVRLSLQPEYSYDLVTEHLPADVRKVLSSGSIQYLPSVYSNCSYLGESASASSVDIRTAATRQSTLSTVGGERKIKFNMLQFYLYYFLSVPTWIPTTTTASTATTATATTTTNTFSMQPRVAPTQQNNTSKPYQYGTVRPPLSSPAQTSINNTIGNANPAYMLQGKPRSLINSVYGPVLEEYLQYFVPIGTSLEFPGYVHTFFLDACVELWIRTAWVTNGQKLNEEFMHYISTFVKYIVRHDLKLCTANTKTLYHHVYTSVKDELYMLISRLALNWSKHDDYLQVVDLWSVWAAPWKLGVAPRSYENQVFTPIDHSWAPFILDNILFYISLVDILLQRTSIFLYKDSIPQQQQQQQQISTTYGDSGTIGGQLRIIYRIINVLKAQGLVDFLANVELGLQKMQSGSLGMMAALPAHQNIFKTMALVCFGSEKMDYVIRDKLKFAYNVLGQLEGTNQTWKPKGLYTNDIQPRSDVLLKTLNAIHNAMLARETNKQTPSKSQKQVQQLKEAYDILYSTFKVTGTGHLISTTTTITTNANNRSSHSPTTQLSGTNVPIKRHTPKLAGLGDGGYLTKEEVLAIRQGKMACSYENIPALGSRAETYVRSYENAFLVRCTLKLDRKLNYHYDRLLPIRYRPNFLPKKLTLRPWAATVNFIYTVIFFSIFLYIFFKIIY